MRKITDAEFEQFVNDVNEFNLNVHTILWDKELKYNKLSYLKGLWVNINKTLEYINSGSPDMFIPDRRQLTLEFDET